MLPTSSLTAVEGRLLGLGFDWWGLAQSDPNLWEVSDIVSAGYSEDTLMSMLDAQGQSLWGAQRNTPIEGMLLMLDTYVKEGWSGPRGTVISEQTPEEAARETFTEGVAQDVEEIADNLVGAGKSIIGSSKYLKYIPAVVGGLVLYKVAKMMRVI